MGFMKSKAPPAAAPYTPPPPLPPVPTPAPIPPAANPATVASASVKAVGQASRSSAAAAEGMGFGSTIMTNPQGLSDQNTNTASKSLLGQ